MKAEADGKCRDVNFEPLDWVYLKLRPYCHSTLLKHEHPKLAPRFIGPFQVLEHIGPLWPTNWLCQIMWLCIQCSMFLNSERHMLQFALCCCSSQTILWFACASTSLWRKCQILWINCERSKVARWASSVGRDVVDFPMSYLGLSLGHNPRTFSFWSPVLDKVRKWLAS